MKILPDFGMVLKTPRMIGSNGIFKISSVKVSKGCRFKFRSLCVLFVYVFVFLVSGIPKREDAPHEIAGPGRDAGGCTGSSVVDGTGRIVTGVLTRTVGAEGGGAGAQRAPSQRALRQLPARRAAVSRPLVTITGVDDETSKNSALVHSCSLSQRVFFTKHFTT